MTIAISVKVHNGVVLAADSASTLSGKTPSGQIGVVNIFTTARKIFNLYKGEPIGLITWGSGSIGHASISTLAKDLREKFKKDDNYKINKHSYQLKDIATLARRFFFEEIYTQEFQNEAEKPYIGFIIAGYSKGEGLPEEWEIKIDKGDCPPPNLIRPKDQTGISWRGEIEAIMRLVNGYGMGLPNVLSELGITGKKLQKAMTLINNNLRVPLSYPPMPIQDAIDLADFLAQATIMFSRFTPGAPTVGGPIDIAAITKHEGFRWVRRKFWYQAELNPKEVSNDE
jgi:20S proteasome alpha/beta subunit